MEAVVGGVATILAAVIVWWLQTRSSNKPATPASVPVPLATEVATASSVYAQRYLDSPSQFRFLKALPKLLEVVRENAHEGWDTGITAEMREANYDVIDFLEYSWVRLSRFYPEKHWGNNQSADDYIRNFIIDRFNFHWAKHEPEGPGTGGTIVGVLTGGDVIADLERLIADTVSSLFAHNADFDLDAWQKAWSERRD